MRQNMSEFQALTASLAAHFLLVFLLSSVPTQTPFQPPIEVELVELQPPPHSKRRQLVREAEVPEDQLTSNNNPARFLAQKRKRVREQTKARLNGKTRNTAAKKPTPQKEQQKPQKKKSVSKPQNLAGISPGEIRKSVIERLEKKPQSIQFPRTPSTDGETLPDNIKLGNMTVLNTDPYLYYSFFRRIEDLIRYRWESRIRAAIPALQAKRYKGYQRQKWPTRVRIVLNQKGKVENAYVSFASGLKEFDIAARDAFVDAAIIPNPPKDLVNSRGKIELDYGFMVYWRPNVLTKR